MQREARWKVREEEVSLKERRKIGSELEGERGGREEVKDVTHHNLIPRPHMRSWEWGYSYSQCCTYLSTHGNAVLVRLHPTV